MPFPAATALVVDDDSDMCRVLELALASAGCRATTAGSGQSAIALFSDHPFSVVFVDARLPDMDGWRVIAELRHRRPEIRVIMISGYYFEDDVRVAGALQAAEIDGFLAKPFRVEAVAPFRTSSRSASGTSSSALSNQPPDRSASSKTLEINAPVRLREFADSHQVRFPAPLAASTRIRHRGFFRAASPRGGSWSSV